MKLLVAILFAAGSLLTIQAKANESLLMTCFQPSMEDEKEFESGMVFYLLKADSKLVGEVSYYSMKGSKKLHFKDIVTKTTDTLNREVFRSVSGNFLVAVSKDGVGQHPGYLKERGVSGLQVFCNDYRN